MFLVLAKTYSIERDKDICASKVNILLKVEIISEELQYSNFSKYLSKHTSDT